MLPDPTTRSAVEDRLFGMRTAGGPIDWLVASGGLSGAGVWQVRLGTEAFAVRRHPGAADPRRVAAVTDTLRTVFGSGLTFVPRPLEGAWPYRDGAGGLWEAAPWAPGAPLSETPSDAGAIAAASAGLAGFHEALRRLPHVGLAAAVTIESRAERLRGVAEGNLTIGSGVATRWPEISEIARRLPASAACALEAMGCTQGDTAAVQPIHGDARPEHFLVTGNELTGLIDFAAMRVDTPLADVARLAGELAAGDADRRDQVVARYEEAAGRPVDRRAVAALDLSGAVLSAANWARWLGEEGADGLDAEAVGGRLRSILARLSP